MLFFAQKIGSYIKTYSLCKTRAIFLRCFKKYYFITVLAATTEKKSHSVKSGNGIGNIEKRNYLLGITNPIGLLGFSSSFLCSKSASKTS